jgi:hypothetical protein
MASQNEQRCSYKAEVRESPSLTADTRLAAGQAVSGQGTI